ncbi:MAG: metal ABC transporter substrate-binding protein [Candidatus Gracilibacteria bacterium]|nr:metal ABC transporter substrate-binding protein [Candidatus Gracilibacteria bacterium]
MKKLIIIVATLAFIITIIGVAGYIKFNVLNDDVYVETNSGSVVKYNDIIQIETSIVPLASITNYIGGDFVEAISIVPTGVSPHGYDLKPEQMVDINKSDLVIYLNLDHIDGFLNKALEKKETLIVSEGIELVEGIEHSHEGEENHEEEGHEEDEHHEDEAHSVDPHIWNGTKNAIIIAEKITKKLSEISPENKEYFENNLNNLKIELETVKNDFLTKINGKEQSEFIIFHDAYNYLFLDLGIDSSKKVVFQKTVLSDPNSAEMKELIDEIKLHGVKVAYKEPQLNDSNLQKLSNDYNLEVLVLDPLVSDSSKNGYIENFKNNLKSLEKIYE